MGLFDKLKNIFIEDEEVVEDVIPTIKKIEPVVEEKELPKVEVPVATKTIGDRELTDTNPKFKFPIIFEDDDFKEEKKANKSINVLERENTKYESDIRRDIRPQKKVFKPSPVISPVYGVLDKNYSKDDISTKDGLLNDSEDKVDIDTIIKKAYGNDEVLGTREEKNKKEEVIVEEEKPIVEETETISIELDDKLDNNELTDDEIDEKIKSIDELLKDTSDEDFYSLVDNMYKDEEENDIE